MKKDCISLAFVAVFAKPLSVVPVPDSEFCKNLFGNPLDTYHGMGPEGYVIAVKNKPVPAVVIGPTKIMVKAHNVEDLAKYVKEFSELSAQKGVSMAYSAYGTNGEYQWLELPSSSTEWMWKRFVNPSMEISPTGSQCTKISFRFIESAEESVNIEVEPRNGVHDGLFVSVNHHHEHGGDALPCQEELTEMFRRSEELFDNKYFKKIITD